MNQQIELTRRRADNGEWVHVAFAEINSAEGDIEEILSRINQSVKVVNDQVIYFWERVDR